MLLPVLLNLAQAATAAPQATPAAEPPAKPKLVCVVQEETGSRLNGKRVCRTQAEWDQMRMDLKQEMSIKQRNTIK